MRTDCGSGQLELQGLGRQEVVGRFDAGRTTSDAGELALREVAERSGMLRRFAERFTDHRDPVLIEHTVEELITQRVMANACGYEDLNDHNELRDDAVLALACGKADLQGGRRRRERDRGHALAGAATLNRLGLTPADANRSSRYKKTVYDGEAIERFFVEVAMSGSSRVGQAGCAARMRFFRLLETLGLARRSASRRRCFSAIQPRATRR